MSGKNSSEIKKAFAEGVKIGFRFGRSYEKIIAAFSVFARVIRKTDWEKVRLEVEKAESDLANSCPVEIKNMRFGVQPSLSAEIVPAQIEEMRLKREKFFEDFSDGRQELWREWCEKNSDILGLSRDEDGKLIWPPILNGDLEK